MPENQAIIDDFSDEDKVETNLNFWDFKEQKQIVGLFVKWENDNYGEHAIIQTDETEEQHLPNLKALNGKLKASDIKAGDKVKIVYLGKAEAKTGRLYEDFDVFIKNYT